MLKQKKIIFLLVILLAGVLFYFRENILISTVWRFESVEAPSYEIAMQKGLIIPADRIMDDSFVSDTISLANQAEINTVAIQLDFRDDNFKATNIGVIINKAHSNNLYCQLQLFFPNDYEFDALVARLDEWSRFSQEKKVKAVSLSVSVNHNTEKDLNQLIEIVKSNFDGSAGIIFPFVTKILNVNATQADRVEMMLNVNEIDEETFEKNINFAVSNLTPTLIKDGKKEVVINVNSMTSSNKKIETLLGSVYATLHYRVDGFNTLIDPSNEAGIKVIEKWYKQF